MKLWMTRDSGKVGIGTNPIERVRFWIAKPRGNKTAGYITDDGAILHPTLSEWKSLLPNEPLPRKGTKRLVDVSISIKTVKGGWQ